MLNGSPFALYYSTCMHASLYITVVALPFRKLLQVAPSCFTSMLFTGDGSQAKWCGGNGAVLRRELMDSCRKVANLPDGQESCQA